MFISLCLWLFLFDKRDNQAKLMHNVSAKLRIPNNNICSDHVSIVSTYGNDGLHCEDVSSACEDLPSSEEHVRVLVVMRLVRRGITLL